MKWAIVTFLLTFLVAKVLSGTEQTQIIDRARETALEYTHNLPNFITTQTTRRQYLPKGSQTWKAEDTLVFDLAFTEGREQYTLLTVNGKPTTKTKGETGGLNMSGEFGSDLRGIFDPKSEARFKWEHPGNLRNRPVDVFSYHIDKTHSAYQWKLRDDDGKEHKGILPYHGLVYVDRETDRVLRFTTVVDDIPSAWPISGSSGEVDYDFVSIDGKPFLLPIHAETRVMSRKGVPVRTVVEFSNYHRFSSGVTLSVVQ